MPLSSNSCSEAGVGNAGETPAVQLARIQRMLLLTLARIQRMQCLDCVLLILLSFVFQRHGCDARLGGSLVLPFGHLGLWLGVRRTLGRASVENKTPSIYLDPRVARLFG